METSVCIYQELTPLPLELHSPLTLAHSRDLSPCMLKSHPKAAHHRGGRQPPTPTNKLWGLPQSVTFIPMSFLGAVRVLMVGPPHPYNSDWTALGWGLGLPVFPKLRRWFECPAKAENQWARTRTINSCHQVMLPVTKQDEQLLWLPNRIPWTTLSCYRTPSEYPQMALWRLCAAVKWKPKFPLRNFNLTFQIKPHEVNTYLT